jgi:hypothetical protein
LSTSALNAYIDFQAGLLAESQARNFQQFPILDQYIFPNPPQQINASYQAVVNDLKDWVNKRAAWMDSNIPGYCNTVGVEDLTLDNREFKSYPNPFNDHFTLKYSLTDNSKVSYEVCNMLGERVIYQSAEPMHGGIHEVELQTGDLTAGTYIVKLHVNEQTYYQKIVKSQSY